MKINQLINESRMTCSECGGPAFSDLILAEKKDACYQKVKASAKVWPSAYASGRLVQCRKKGAANYGNKSEGVAEGSLNEFASGSEGSNGPFDYGSAIVRIGQDFVDFYNDEGAGADAAAIIKVGKTFMSAGMAAGIKAFYAMDTQLRDHVAEQLADEGFNVRQDIYEPHRQAQTAPAAGNGIQTILALLSEFVKTVQEPEDRKTIVGIYKAFQQGMEPGFVALFQGAAFDIDANFYKFARSRGVDLDKVAAQAGFDTDSLLEGVAEDYNPEYDDEAGMADNNLETLARAVEGIDDVISAGDNLPEWCQEKIAVAKSMLVAVWDYMKSEENIEQGVSEGVRDLGYDAQSLIMKLRRDVEEKRLQPTRQAVLSAARELAGDMDFAPELLVRQVLGQGVSEGICSIQEANEIFDDFERSVAARGLTEDIFDSITDEQIIAETAAWRRKEGKSKSGGLNAKGVASYRRENPGSKLQTAVTTKPSKLKPGSKAAKRRKSFCARMGGVKGPMKKPNGKPTRKALALRKWNC